MGSSASLSELPRPIDDIGFALHTPDAQEVMITDSGGNQLLTPVSLFSGNAHDRPASHLYGPDQACEPSPCILPI
jgi:hypothetical protein